MGYYNVVQPCVVGKLHHTRPTTQPIEVDDEAAAPLVQSGCLELYPPRRIEGPTGAILDGLITAPASGVNFTPPWPVLVDTESGEGTVEPAPEPPPAPRRPRSRKRAED